MSLALSLKLPEEIRPDEVVNYWEKLSIKTPYDCYEVYRSPNRELWACIDKKKGKEKDEKAATIALMWNVHTGQVHQENREALYPLVSRFGGWIG